MTTTRLDTIMDLLITLKNQNIKLLFDNSIFCLSFIKVLDKFSKNIVLHLCSSSMNLNVLQTDKFFLDSKEKIHNSLKILKSLNVIEKRDTQIFLVESFRINLLKGFCTLKPENFFKTENNFLNEDSDVFNLYFEVILEKKQTKTRKGILRLLISSNIITNTLEITNIGFDFLLKTKKEQIWFLLIQALKDWKQNEDDLVTSILYLFEMSLINNKRCFSLKNRNIRMIELLNYLTSLGFINESNNKYGLSDMFLSLYKEEEYAEEKFMYIETNFKCYAYTTSKYDLNVLSLFCNVNHKLPDMICAILTEDSLDSAFKKQITAKQINHYLKSKSKNFPLNVSEQIEIWESKNNRIKTEDSILIKGFLQQSGFKKCLNFAKERKFIICHYEDKRTIIINTSAYTSMKEFIIKNNINT